MQSGFESGVGVACVEVCGADGRKQTMPEGLGVALVQAHVNPQRTEEKAFCRGVVGPTASGGADTYIYI